MSSEKRITLIYISASTGKESKLSLTGAKVGYTKADEVLGEDFVKVFADNQAIVVHKDSVVLIQIADAE